jgi:hypothetical protein
VTTESNSNQESDPPSEPEEADGSTDDGLALGLAEPASPSDLYLEESSPYRPICTGDIFVGHQIVGARPDESAHELVMVLSHPCAMRKGPALEPRVRAAPIMPVSGIKRSSWTTGSYDYFPLPTLADVASWSGFTLENKAWASVLTSAAPLETHDLRVERRIACLSPAGIHILLQRLVHADTRAAIKIDTLAKTFEPQLIELELLETWNEYTLPEAPGEVDLARAAAEFEDLMMTSFTSEFTFRQSLALPIESAKAVRAITSMALLRVPD